MDGGREQLEAVGPPQKCRELARCGAREYTHRRPINQDTYLGTCNSSQIPYTFCTAVKFMYGYTVSQSADAIMVDWFALRDTSKYCIPSLSALTSHLEELSLPRWVRFGCIIVRIKSLVSAQK
jgi:hypothetical protein